MKLFVVLSVLACGYAAKLDRTYLPPDSAATAGGSPGSLIAPIQSGSGFQRGHSSFGFQPEGSTLSQGSSRNQNSFNGFISTNNGALNGHRHAMPISYTSGPKTGPSPQTKYVSSEIGSKYNNVQDHLNQGFAQESKQDLAREYTPERPQAATDRNAEILRNNKEENIGSYGYSYETSNGISFEEVGEASNGVRAQGAYSYTDDDNNSYSITYTADENGYQPQGEHLPTSPPIPEEIVKSIEENARAAAAGTQEGAYRPEEYVSEVSQQYGAGSYGLNQPQSEGYGPDQRFHAHEAHVISRPQETQYSTSHGQQDQVHLKSQSGSSGLFKGNTQSHFDNSQISPKQGQETNGYRYNKPQNVFGSSGLENRPLAQNSQQQTRYSGPTSGFLSNNVPTLRTQTHQTESNQQSGNQIPRQGHLSQAPTHHLKNNQASYQSPQRTPSSGSTQHQQFRSTVSSGYQYQPNQNTFGSNDAGNHESGKQDNFLYRQGNQFGIKENVGNINEQRAAFNGNHNIHSSSQNGIHLGSRVSTSNGSRGSETLQAPYQYNRPDQSFGNQQQRSGNVGFNRNHGSGQFSGPRQPPSFTPEDGYKY